MAEALNRIKITCYFILKVIFVVLAISLGVFFIFLLLDRQGSCASDGKVWDPKQNICRDDCLKWSQEEGCIPIPEQYKK